MLPCFQPYEHVALKRLWRHSRAQHTHTPQSAFFPHLAPTPRMQKLSRKMVHMLAGPGFLLCWPLFSAAPTARFVAMAVPALNGLRLLLVGTGAVKDERAVKVRQGSAGWAGRGRGGLCVCVGGGGAMGQLCVPPYPPTHPPTCFHAMSGHQCLLPACPMPACRCFHATVIPAACFSHNESMRP